MVLQTEIAIRGASPGSIVEQFDVFKDPGLGRFHRPVILGVDQFDLQSAEEWLHNHVVPAIHFLAHAAAQSVIL